MRVNINLNTVKVKKIQDYKNLPIRKEGVEQPNVSQNLARSAGERHGDVICKRNRDDIFRKPPSLFRMTPSLTPTTSPSHKMGPKCIHNSTNFAKRTATWRLANMIQDIVKAAVPDVIMSRAMTPSA